MIPERCFLAAISQTADFEKHLNQYDVIHLDIQWFLSNVSDPEQIVAYITECTLAELRTVYCRSASAGSFHRSRRSVPDQRGDRTEICDYY